MGSCHIRHKSLCVLSVVILISFSCCAAAAPGRKHTDSASSPDFNATAGSLADSVAGPIVRAVVDKLKDANDTDVASQKKTIAQYIEVALEQEFPEAKEEAIGKNYNETAKQSDVRAVFAACVGNKRPLHSSLLSSECVSDTTCRLQLRQS